MHRFSGLLRIGAGKGIGLVIDTKTLHGIDYIDHTPVYVGAEDFTSGRFVQLNDVGKWRCVHRLHLRATANRRTTDARRGGRQCTIGVC